jgi:hypothetical protein
VSGMVQPPSCVVECMTPRPTALAPTPSGRFAARFWQNAGRCLARLALRWHA